MSSLYVFWRNFGWDVRFCCNSWYSFLVLPGSLQQNHVWGFSSSFPTTPPRLTKWYCGSLKIGLSEWFKSAKSICFVLFSPSSGTNIYFVKLFTDVIAFISTDLAFPFRRGQNIHLSFVACLDLPWWLFLNSCNNERTGLADF